MLPCIYFIKLGGLQRCVEGEKGVMEQKSLKTLFQTVVLPTFLFEACNYVHHHV